ncbi:MAG: SEC-C domain-containing protein [Desulfobulbaceae bacterium]|nr:SEC-C domain-containing protein [Desulfobulbaceae bacterium]
MSKMGRNDLCPCGSGDKFKRCCLLMPKSVPIQSATRGIVVGSRIDPINGSIKGSFDNQDILRWLLYWDHISYAGISIKGMSITGYHSSDILFLESSGIFKTQIVDMTSALESLPPPEKGKLFFSMGSVALAGNQLAIIAAAARVSLSNHLSETTGKIWSIGQAGGEELILPGFCARKELIDIQLINCLPVPHADTSFEDILEFKDRYHDELRQLRRSFDGLRENVLRSVDERRAIEQAVHEISTSLASIQSALNSKGIKTFPETIALYTNNPSLTFWTSLGGIAAAATGIPMEVGLATGLALPTICRFIVRSIEGGNNLPNYNSDFAYVYEVVKHLN